MIFGVGVKILWNKPATHTRDCIFTLTPNIMDTAKLEAMLASGEDNALLRFTLGNVLFQQKKYAEAEPHLARAVELDPNYSAAWKIYGRTLGAAGKTPAAVAALTQGIEIASERGDVQAAKEMTVFLRRLEKLSADDLSADDLSADYAD